MDPSLRPDQAETFTEVLKAMGDAAKSPEVVQEISVAVKKIEEGISAATFSIRLHCWSIGQPFRSTFKGSTVLWPSVVWPTVNEPTVNRPTVNRPPVNWSTVNWSTVSWPIVNWSTTKQIRSTTKLIGQLVKYWIYNSKVVIKH